MAIQSTNNNANGYYNSLLGLDRKLAKKYAKMPQTAKEIADRGLNRHFTACLKNDLSPDAEAVKEVLKGALRGRRSYC